jgi:hypothetical protein
MSLENPVPKPDQDQTTYEVTAEARRVITVDGYIQRIAYNASNQVLYLGLAAPGTADASAGWQIRKFTYSETNLVSIDFADGNTKFDNAWDLRGSFSYG